MASRTDKEPWSGEIRIIAVAGRGQDSDLWKSAEAGFDHHLVKPVQYSHEQALSSARTDN